MPNDYIPRPDTEFDVWLTNFVTNANANLVALGLLAADMTPITTAQTTWKTALGNNVAAQAAPYANR